MMAAAVFAASASSARAERVELATGDVLIGRIISRADGVVVMEHPVLGQVRLAAESVRNIEGDAKPQAAPGTAAAASPAPAAEVKVADAPKPAPPEAPKKAEPTPAPVAAEPPKPAVPFYRQWLEGWKMQLALGGSFRDSNRDTLDVNARLTGSFADKKDRWKVDMAYYRSQVDENETRNEIRAFVQKDWLLPDSPWFFFGQGQYDYDQYKSWDHRLSMHGGLGYSLKELVGFDLDLRGGAGVTREFGGVDPNTRPESLFGSELAWQVTKEHKVAATAQVFPGLDGFHNYRLVTTADWTMKLTEELGLRLGMRDEYDSAEPEGFQPNDLRVYGSLVFSF